MNIFRDSFTFDWVPFFGERPNSETAFPKRYLESPHSPTPHALSSHLSRFHHHVPAPLVWKSWIPPPYHLDWHRLQYLLIHIMAKLYTWISKHGYQVFCSSSMHRYVYEVIVSSKFVVWIVKFVVWIVKSVYKLALFLGSHVWENLGTCKTIQTSTCHGSYHACDYLCSWAMRKNPGMKFFMCDWCMWRGILVQDW